MKAHLTILLFVLAALKCHGAFGLGTVATSGQPWSMEGWRVWAKSGEIEQSKFKPTSRIACIFREVQPGLPVQFRCRVSDDGGTWLLFYRPDVYFDPLDPFDYKRPVDFISGFEWKAGTLHELSVVNGRLTYIPVEQYQFTGRFARDVVTPPDAGFILVGTWKEFDAVPPPPAATLELLGI